MADSLFLFSDGKFLKTGKPLILPDNRSFRYGDGFFETIKWKSGELQLINFHMERFFYSLATLKFKPPHFFTADYVIDAIHSLIKKNQHHNLARIRLTVYRGEGGIYDHQNHFPHLLIQTWDLNESNNRLNENGLELGIFTKAIKSADHFSMIKSNNYLSYVMAAIWAKEEKLNDAILLNQDGNLVDTTIANLFIIVNGVVKTPPIADGPINGVMRRHVIVELKKWQYEIEESSVTMENIEQASEFFLTNAIYGIRWVKQIGNTHFSNEIIRNIYPKIMNL